MPKGFCPVCNERQEITVTDEPLGYVGFFVGTARKWQVAPHPPDNVPPIAGAPPVFCKGSGRLI